MEAVFFVICINYSNQLPNIYRRHYDIRNRLFRCMYNCLHRNSSPVAHILHQYKGRMFLPVQSYNSSYILYSRYPKNQDNIRFDIWYSNNKFVSRWLNRVHNCRNQHIPMWKFPHKYRFENMFWNWLGCIRYNRLNRNQHNKFFRLLNNCRRQSIRKGGLSWYKSSFHRRRRRQTCRKDI